jgi:hypothetical protein
VSAEGRVKGKYYLIIERTAHLTDADRLDAEAIADFCNKNNFPCGVVQYGTQSYAVWSLQPFDSSTSPEALDYAKKVEDLGKRYKPPPGRGIYKFKQEDKTGHFNPLFPKE